LSVMNATGFSIDILVPFAIAVLTLSAGGVGPSFKSSRSKPHFYDQSKSNARRRAALQSRASLAHFAMWTSRLITPKVWQTQKPSSVGPVGVAVFIHTRKSGIR